MAEPSASVSTPVETNETNGDHKAERKTVNKPPEEKNGRSRSLSRRSDRSQRVAVKSRSRSRSLDRSRSRSLSRRRRKKKKHKKRKKKRRRRSSRSYSRSSSRSGDYSRSRSRSKKRKREREQERSASVQSENSEAGLTPEQIEEKKELERLTRDARTVFVSQLQVKVVETDIKKYFERVCKIKDVVLIKDRFTNRSKGYGYVELRTLEDVPKALLLSGQKFIFPNGKEGFPIKVKASEAEKNFTHFMEKKTNTATATYHGNANNSSRQRAQFKNHPVLREPWDDKIEIKGLHPDIDVAQVKELCEPFGEVADLDLVKDFQGRSTGQCFVHFVSRTDAKEAVRELDGLKLVEYKLKVYKMQKGQISKLKGTSQRDVDKLIGVESDAAGELVRGELCSGLIVLCLGATGGAFSTNTWRLEADDPNEGQYGGGGVAMNSSQKMSLMSKLAGGAGNELLMQTQQKISSTGGKQTVENRCF